MVDVKKLEAEMNDFGIKKNKFAEKCGYSRQTLDRKLAKPETITAEDVRKMTEALRIEHNTELVMEIFFAPDVAINGNK